MDNSRVILKYLEAKKIFNIEYFVADFRLKNGNTTNGSPFDYNSVAVVSISDMKHHKIFDLVFQLIFLNMIEETQIVGDMLATQYGSLHVEFVYYDLDYRYIINVINGKVTQEILYKIVYDDKGTELASCIYASHKAETLEERLVLHQFAQTIVTIDLISPERLEEKENYYYDHTGKRHTRLHDNDLAMYNNDVKRMDAIGLENLASIISMLGIPCTNIIIQPHYLDHYDTHFDEEGNMVVNEDKINEYVYLELSNGEIPMMIPINECSMFVINAFIIAYSIMDMFDEQNIYVVYNMDYLSNDQNELIVRKNLSNLFKNELMNRHNSQIIYSSSTVRVSEAGQSGRFTTLVEPKKQ